MIKRILDGSFNRLAQRSSAVEHAEVSGLRFNSFLLVVQLPVQVLRQMWAKSNSGSLRA